MRRRVGNVAASVGSALLVWLGWYEWLAMQNGASCPHANQLTYLVLGAVVVVPTTIMVGTSAARGRTVVAIILTALVVIVIVVVTIIVATLMFAGRRHCFG